MTRQQRRRVGAVFVASGGLMLLVAALFGLGIVPVQSSVRTIVGAVLGVAGAVETVVGVRMIGERDGH